MYQVSLDDDKMTFLFFELNLIYKLISLFYNCNKTYKIMLFSALASSCCFVVSTQDYLDHRQRNELKMQAEAPEVLMLY